MAKKPNHRPKAVKKDDTMNGAMKFFLAGCVAELFLLIVRRFYIYGTLAQVVAWDSILKVLAWVGAAVLAAGAVLSVMWKAEKRKKVIGWCVAGAGTFVALVCFLVRMNLSLLTLFYVVVPVVMLLVVLWSLYDRECALALTVLGTALLAMWACRRAMFSLPALSKIAAAVAIVLMIAVIVIAWKAAKNGGKVGKWAFFAPKADMRPVYVACVLGIAGVATILMSAVVAYYAMLLLAAVTFAFAIYYTVKQL